MISPSQTSELGENEVLLSQATQVAVVVCCGGPGTGVHLPMISN